MTGLILALSTGLKLLPSVGLVRFEKLPGWRGGLVLFPPGTGEGLQAPGTDVLALVHGLPFQQMAWQDPPLSLMLMSSALAYGAVHCPGVETLSPGRL